MTRIRTLEFLPSIFQTPTNNQFLSATLDQLVNPPVIKTIEGYIGSKLGYGINAKDYYVTEPSKIRKDYQLEPGVIFTKTNESIAKDFISYPGILDSINLQGGLTNNNDRLFNSQFYSWDSFTDLDKLINYSQYYWLPEGPPSVTISSSAVFKSNQFIVNSLPNVYNIRPITSNLGSDNPTITLLRGGTYEFIVNQSTQFWIQGEPGISGFSPNQNNLYTREILGVSNNGANDGVITFNVPQKDAQNEFLFPGNNQVGVISERPFSEINGATLSQIGNIDGVTALNGVTVLFYNTGVPNEIGYISNFYGENNFDVNGNLVAPLTVTATAIDSTGNITVSDVSNINIGQTITFVGNSFGNIDTYSNTTSFPISSSNFINGKKYFIGTVGTTDWIAAGVTPNASLDAEIIGTELRIHRLLSGTFGTGMTLSGPSVSASTKILGFDPLATNQNFEFANNITIGNLYSIRSFETDGGDTTDFTLAGAEAAAIVNADISGNILNVNSFIISASKIVAGQECEILTTGTTDYTLIGATSNTVGTTFIATGAGLGTGTVKVNTGYISIGSYLTGAGLESGTFVTERIYSGSTPTNSYYVNKTQILSETILTVQPGLGSFFVATAAGTGTGTVGIPTYTIDTPQTVLTETIDVYNITSGQLFTSTGPQIGTGTATLYDVSIYYVVEIDNINDTIKISETLAGPIFAPGINDSGLLVANINQGLLEEGYYTNVNDYFYTINFIGDVNDPVLQLRPASLIPTEQKIIALYGTKYIGLGFYKNQAGFIERIPYLSAPLNTLYYQDSTNPNKIGIIKLIESNTTNTLNVDLEILGKKNFTSSNGVIFTNGLKVKFSGDIIPTSYLQDEYYVEGVGTAIELISVSSMIVPENYTDDTSIPFDILPYDIGNYDNNLYIPVNPDYITIARNSLNKNPWARSNRWFHEQVIQDTANYLNNPEILTTLANGDNKAKRPIIEFYPNLKLFQSGTFAKNAVDFIDTRTVDPFNLVAGQANYYPDVETYTGYVGTIFTNPFVTTGAYLENQIYNIINLGTTNVETWETVGSTLVTEGNFTPGIEYIIWDKGTTTDAEWNAIAGTIDITYNIGDKFTATNPGLLSGSDRGSALTVNFKAQTSGQYNSINLLPDTEYLINIFGTTNWKSLGAPEHNVSTLEIPVNVTSLIIGKNYTITSLGDTTQSSWNTIAGTVDVLYEVGSNFTCRNLGIGTGAAGTPYFILNLGSLTQTTWNNICGTTGIVYKPGDLIVPITTVPIMEGSLIKRQFTTNSIISGLAYSAVGTGFVYQGTGLSLSMTTTKINVPKNDVTGNLSVGMYINDLILGQQSRLPPNTRILSIEGSNILSIEVFWALPTIIQSGSNASFVASTKNNIDLSIFPGARIVFDAEQNPALRNKIYVANFSTLFSSFPVITLTEAVDGELQQNDQFVVIRGQNNQGLSFYFDDNSIKLALSKTDINQAPKFDIFDRNGISLSDQTVYQSSTFDGNELFKYKLGNGISDSILGFPISYSGINNINDITFEIALNDSLFNYVNSITNEPITQSVNTGFVHNYLNRLEYLVNIGWQTAIAPSAQNQVFEFEYTPTDTPVIFRRENGEKIIFTVECDIPTLSRDITVWPNIQVFNNNNLLNQGSEYVVVFENNKTIVQVFLDKNEKTIIQILIISDKVSDRAYYSIPINLSNNPFNADIINVDMGDIRNHYQTIYQNNPLIQGQMFGDDGRPIRP